MTKPIIKLTENKTFIGDESGLAIEISSAILPDIWEAGKVPAASSIEGTFEWATIIPSSHAASHITGGSDVIDTAISGGNAGLMSGTDKAKLDGYYVNHISLWLDIKIFFGTITSIFKSEGVVEGGTGTIKKSQNETNKEK